MKLEGGNTNLPEMLLLKILPLSYFYLKKNVQPQFEDYAHVCMCYSNLTVELMVGG